VATGFGEAIDEGVANLSGEFTKILIGKLFDITGGMDGR